MNRDYTAIVPASGHMGYVDSLFVVFVVIIVIM